MEGGVTTYCPSGKLEHDGWNTSQVSNKVHEIVYGSTMRNLINLKSEVNLRDDVLHANRSGLVNICVILKIIKKDVSVIVWN